MTVRRSLAALFACLALWFSAGCGGGSGAPTVDEVSDPLYQQAQDLKKQGRNGEALNAFLKVIDRRGENGAPESHLEAGALYLNWSKDPVEAYHHFGKFLEVQPVGPKSDMVRGQRDVAKRDVILLMAGRTGEQAGGAPSGEDAQVLRRRIQELEAEIQTLRGSSGVPVVRAAPVISMPEERPASEAVANSDVPVTAAPPSESPFVRGLATPASRPAPANAAAPVRNAAAAPQRTASASAQPANERVITTPTRPGATPRAVTAPTGARRSHTVAPGDKSLWGIARRYYGANATSAQVQGIYLANRDTMRSPSDLRAGMVLRIP